MKTPYLDYDGMFSDWYAVDRDGYLGLFKTGDNGVMPVQSPHYWDAHLSECLAQITPGLKRLYLPETLIENILQKCNMEMIENIIRHKNISDCMILLADGKTWEDLAFEAYFANSKNEWNHEYAVSLSPDIPLFWISKQGINKPFEAAKRNKIIIAGCKVNLDKDLIYHYSGCYTQYTREYVPQIPLHISQLSEEAQSQLPKLEVSFKDPAFVQMLAYVPVKSFFDIKFDIEEYHTVKNIDGATYALLPISETEDAWCLMDEIVDMCPLPQTEEDEEKLNVIVQKMLAETGKKPRMLKYEYAVSPEMYNELQTLKDFVQFVYNNMSEEWKSDEKNIQQIGEIIRLIETIDRHHNKYWSIEFKIYDDENIRHPENTIQAKTWKVCFYSKNMTLEISNEIHRYYYSQNGEQCVYSGFPEILTEYCFGALNIKPEERGGGISDFIADVFQYKSYMTETLRNKQLTIKI